MAHGHPCGPGVVEAVHESSLRDGVEGLAKHGGRYGGHYGGIMRNTQQTLILKNGNEDGSAWSPMQRACMSTQGSQMRHNMEIPVHLDSGFAGNN